MSDAICSIGRCDGSGWLQIEAACSTVKPCDCRTMSDPSVLCKRASVPERYTRSRITNFSLDHLPEIGSRARQQGNTALKACDQYLKKWTPHYEGGEATGQGLLFWGGPGSGKTHLAVGLLHALILEHRVQGVFTNWMQLMVELKRYMISDEEKYYAIIERVRDCELLVLDELGAARLTDWRYEILHDIIDTRYRTQRPTLITTNSTPEPESQEVDRLDDMLPALLYSRIVEISKTINLSAMPDYRELRITV